MSDKGTIVTVEEGGARYLQRIRVGRHELVADEPPEKGGGDAGPTPYEMMLSALGACTTMTLRMYADMKKIPLRRVAVEVRHRKVPAEESPGGEARAGKVDWIECHVALEGDLSDEQRARLMDIAHRCPVHKALKGEAKVRVHAVS